MTERLVADAAARKQALDPQTSFIVQAPAGSGESYASRMFCRSHTYNHATQQNGGECDD